MIWTMQPLPTHPNGMRFSVFDAAGDLLATNAYYSVGGGFVVNSATQGTWFYLLSDLKSLSLTYDFTVDENLYYRSIHKDDASAARREQNHGLGDKALPAPGGEAKEEEKDVKEKVEQPRFLFRNAQGLLAMTEQHNVDLLAPFFLFG